MDGGMGLKGIAILTGSILAAVWGVQLRERSHGGPCGLLSARRRLVVVHAPCDSSSCCWTCGKRATGQGRADQSKAKQSSAAKGPELGSGA